MKKMTFLLSTILITGLYTTVISQTQISVITGIHSANTHTSMINEDLVDFNPINNISAGIIAERPIDKFLSLRTGVIYQKNGFQINESTGLNVLGMNLPLGIKLRNEINYLEVPLMLKYQNNNQSIQPYLAIGPSLGYALSGSLKTRATAILDFSIATIDMDLSSNNYNRLEISGNVLAGVTIPYGTGNIFTELGYSHALNNFIDEDFIVNTGGKHKGWTFSIGYGMKF